MDFFLYLLIGAGAGFLSGLFGLGGGIIVVPALIFLFTANDLSPEIITHLAIGTSLATIIVTSIASTTTHHQMKSVRWDIVRWISPGIVVGSIFGGVLAATISGPLLQLLFGGLMIVVSVQLLLVPSAGDFSVPNKLQIGVVGAFIGALSSLFGIGGGTLSTPYLFSLGIKIRQAVATSAACGLPIAVVGTTTYFLTGLNQQFLPPGSFGFIFAPAWLGIVVASMPFARIGALLAHRINERRLKRLFAGIILFLGARFIWLNALILLV